MGHLAEGKLVIDGCQETPSRDEFNSCGRAINHEIQGVSWYPDRRCLFPSYSLGQNLDAASLKSGQPRYAKAAAFDDAGARSPTNIRGSGALSLLFCHCEHQGSVSHSYRRIPAGCVA